MHVGEAFGLCGGEVLRFGDVGFEVVEFEGRVGLGANDLPIALAEGGGDLLIAEGLPGAIVTGEFPIEVVVGLLLFAFEGGEQAPAVDVFGGRLFRNGGGGGQEVHEVPGVVGDAAGGDFAGLAGDHGDAQTAFVHGGFVASEGAVGTEDVLSVDSFVVAAVVASEEDEGVFVRVELFEFAHDLADVAVDFRDHGGVGLASMWVRGEAAGLFAPGDFFRKLAGVRGFGFGGSEGFPVGNGEGDVEKERISAADFAEPVEGFAHHVVVGIDAALAAGVGGDGGEFVVMEEALRVLVVGVHLVEKAAEFVEAFFPGNADGADVAEAPLAEAAGFVAGLFEDLGDGDIAFEEGDAAGVGTHAGVAHVFAGHQDATRRGADGAAGVGVGEAGAFSGQLIDVGGLDVLLAVAAGIAPAHVVSHDPDDIGLALLRGL